MTFRETAQNISEYKIPNSPESRRNRLKHITVPLAAIAMTVVGGGAVVEGIQADRIANTCVAGDETVTALRGESVWSIAQDIAPNASIETTINHLIQANPELAHPDHVLQEGETLSIPVCGVEK